MQDSNNNHYLIDPEPFSTLVLALGAAGSIASLLSYLEDRFRARNADREANRFAIRDAIMGAETALNELRGLVRSLEIVFVVGSRARGGDDALRAPAQFGSVGLTFTRDGYERWREIDNDLIVTAGRIQKHMGDLMRHFATTNLRLPERTAEHLQRTLDQLNRVVHSLHQTHFGALFHTLEAVVGECTDVMRTLRTDLDDWLR